MNFHLEITFFLCREWYGYELRYIELSSNNSRPILPIEIWLPISDSKRMGGNGPSIRLPHGTYPRQRSGILPHFPTLPRLRLAIVATVSSCFQIQRDLFDHPVGLGGNLDF